MNRIEELLHNLYPNGVSYFNLGSLGTFLGGLTGKTKKDFERGNKRFISYMNVYNNQSVRADLDDYVAIKEGEKQTVLQYGDVIFTGSSETRDDSCMASVVDFVPQEELYLNSFCFVFRFDESVLIPKFSRYLFRSSDVRKQLIRTVSGVTRFNVSKEKMKYVQIPVPPIEIQETIVGILDSFSNLNDGLLLEVSAREKQYAHYRDRILDFNSNGIECDEKCIVDICKSVSSGGTPKSTVKEYYDGTIPWLRTQEVDWKDIYDTGVKITQLGYDNSSAKMIPANCVVVAMYGATAGKVAINKIPLCTNQACCNLEIDKTKALYEYVYYCLCKDYLVLKGRGQGSQSNINAGIVKAHSICVPSLEIQKDLVEKIRVFIEAIESLKMEYDLRMKQFEYYRDRLLDFKKESEPGEASE